MVDMGAACVPRSERRSLLVFAAVILFAVAFIGTATYLGLKDRTRYQLEPDPSLSEADRWVAEALGTRRPFWPRRFRPAPGDPGEPGASMTLHDQAADDLRSGKADLAAAEGAFARASAEAQPGPASFNLGLVRLLQGKASEAITPLEESLRGDPEDGEAHFLLGLALETLGRSEEASFSLARAANLAPDDPDLLQRAGRNLLKRGRVAEALVQAEQVVRIAPGWVEGHRLLGEACLAVQDHGRAKRAFLNVLQLRPQDLQALAAVRRLDGS